MPILESGATRLSYQGYRFLVYKSEVSGRPEYVDSKRTVKWMAWTITVRGLVYADPNDDSTDAQLEEMRRVLSRNCGRLEYSRKGFGDFIINSGNVWDANYGPKVELMDFVTVGDKRAAWVTWKCTAHIPECPNATFRNGLAAFEFKDSYEIHQNGLVTVTIGGYIEIPMTKQRINNPRPVDHINNYRDLVSMPVPLGFRARSRTWDVSLDKRRADFSYTWEQLPKPLPFGATDADIEHSYGSTLRDGFVKWRGTISGSISLSPRSPADLGLAHFMEIVVDRLRFANDPNLPPVGGIQPFSRRNTLIIDKIDIREKIFGLTSHYSVSYRLIIGGISGQNRRAFMDRVLRVSVANSGLWRPLRDRVSFLNWQSVQADDSMRLRGAFDVEVNSASETIIDLCINQRPTLGTSTSMQVNPDYASGGSGQSNGTPINTELLPSAVLDGAGSAEFLDYRIYLDYEERGDRWAWNQPTGNELTENSLVGDVGRLFRQNEIKPDVVGSVTMDSPGLMHEVAAPRPIVRLVGIARRYSAQIPLPRLVRLGGQQAYLNRVVYSRQGVEEVHNGIPMITHVFSVEYFLESPPNQSILPPANPYLGYDPSLSQNSGSLA